MFKRLTANTQRAPGDSDCTSQSWQNTGGGPGTQVLSERMKTLATHPQGLPETEN
jgi:hypothetical protein